MLQMTEKEMKKLNTIKKILKMMEMLDLYIKAEEKKVKRKYQKI